MLIHSPKTIGIVQEILQKNWENYIKDPYPKDRRMAILKDVHTLSTENIKFLINEIVRLYAKVYLEVGVFKGGSLLSAALFNTARCIGIDNFSEFKDKNNNLKTLETNLEKFSLLNINFYNMDYKKAIKKIFNETPSLKIDCYFYDGAHNREDSITGLEIMSPHLSEKCIIIADDTNWAGPREGIKTFLRNHPDFQLEIDIKSDYSGKKEIKWWNGIMIISRGYALMSDKEDWRGALQRRIKTWLG